MLFLTAAQPDPVALLMVLALALVVGVMVLRKLQQRRRAAAAPAEPICAAPAVPVPEPKKAPGSAGKLKLHDVEPKTAAMLMAIVADKLGKPINELRFISIKEVKN